jgi:hypothetical protein
MELVYLDGASRLRLRSLQALRRRQNVVRGAKVLPYTLSILRLSSIAVVDPLASGADRAGALLSISEQPFLTFHF